MSSAFTKACKAIDAYTVAAKEALDFGLVDGILERRANAESDTR